VAATRELLLTAGPARLDGVQVIGVDEHKWSPVLGADADGLVTVTCDLTDVVAGHGPARLLDMASGRSAAAMAGWLAARDQTFRDGVQIVAMDGFGGDKSAAVEPPSPGTSSTCAASAFSKTPSATAAAAGTRSTGYGARGAPETGCSPTASGPVSPRCLPTTPTSRSRRPGVPTSSSSTPTPSATRNAGKTLPTTLIDKLRTELPAGLDELATLARTLHRRRTDILAYFDHRASNGPTEAINGRLEALRRNALGFRNLVNYRIRALLHGGALALQIRKRPETAG
jgi:transposase